jgi:hypothetical protein
MLIRDDIKLDQFSLTFTSFSLIAISATNIKYKSNINNLLSQVTQENVYKSGTNWGMRKS